MRRLRVLLDANVLVEAKLRDLLCSFAHLDLIEVYWSDAILVETRRALTNRMNLTDASVDKLFGQLERIFPDAKVSGFEHRISSLRLPDFDDRHVLAAALHAECDVLVTSNLKDFPQMEVSDPDLIVTSPDDAIVQIVGLHQGAVPRVIASVVTRLMNPPISLEEYLALLSARVPASAMVIGAVLGVESYVEMYDDYRLQDGSSTPQAAVKAVIEAAGAGNEEALTKGISDAFIEVLTAGGSIDIVEACRDALAGALSSEWGLATRPRPAAPGLEIVQLFFGVPIDGVRVINDPTLMSGHQFLMTLVDEEWVLVGIDEQAD